MKFIGNFDSQSVLHTICFHCRSALWKGYEKWKLMLGKFINIFTAKIIFVKGKKIKNLSEYQGKIFKNLSKNQGNNFIILKCFQ